MRWNRAEKEGQFQRKEPSPYLDRRDRLREGRLCHKEAVAWGRTWLNWEKKYGFTDTLLPPKK